MASIQRLRLSLLVLGLMASAAVPAVAQTPAGTAFTYQGHLSDAATPANGSYDLRFTLFEAASGGSPVGSPVDAGCGPDERALHGRARLRGERLETGRRSGWG